MDGILPRFPMSPQPFPHLPFLRQCALTAILLLFPLLSHAGVTLPNGSARVKAEDLAVKTEAGEVIFLRSWNGVEWKFQGHWDGLSGSWKNLTGSQTADTTRPKMAGEGGVLLKTEGATASPEGCWVLVDDAWEPSGQIARVGASGEIEEIFPVERSTPFNQVELSAGAQYVNLDYAMLCGGMIGVSRTAVEVEGIRKGGELYLGSNGRYAFNDRSILERTTIQQPARQSVASLEAGLANGIGTLIYPYIEPAISRAVDWCMSDSESDCDREWREARQTCRALIYEQLQQQAGRRKKRSVTGVTGGYTDVEECARGLVSERCGGNLLVR
jgi:hypothetical protein